MDSVRTTEYMAAGVKNELPSSGRIQRAFGSERPWWRAKLRPPFCEFDTLSCDKTAEEADETHVVHRVEVLLVVGKVESAKATERLSLALLRLERVDRRPRLVAVRLLEQD